MPTRIITSRRHQPRGLEILYEDKDILVVDKAPGLLTIATDKCEDQTAYCRLTDYVRKGNSKSRNRVFIVHRLDRDVSGILIFARNIESKEYLQDHWDDTEKKYLAVVYGWFKEQSGTVSSYLVENQARIVHSTKDTTRGKLSHTAYRVLKETREFSLLEINLLTGRKNQIRAHLAESGHPIVGDKKYGGKDKEFKRVALHAYSLSFTHPCNGEPFSFETRIPSYLNKLVGGVE
jgi:RluA family pseudouridine synthase